MGQQRVFVFIALTALMGCTRAPTDSLDRADVNRMIAVELAKIESSSTTVTTQLVDAVKVRTQWVELVDKSGKEVGSLMATDAGPIFILKRGGRSVSIAVTEETGAVIGLTDGQHGIISSVNSDGASVITHNQIGTKATYTCGGFMVKQDEMLRGAFLAAGEDPIGFIVSQDGKTIWRTPKR